MDLCAGSLADALFASGPARLAAGSALGLAAILGYGALVERALPRRTFSLAHAFLQGTVVVALLRLLLSLAGWCNPSWPLAWLGAALLPLALWRAPLARPSWLAMAAVAAGVPLALRQLSAGMEFGDLTAIWSLHAKALTCECALTRRFAIEPCWAATHGDYPLYLPFLHSFFFTLNASFRDDWVKLWQSLAWLAALAAVARSMGRESRARGAAAVGALLAAAAAEHGWLPFAEGFVELSSVIFASLVACALLDDEPARLPLYLFGLAFTKHEGLMVAALFVLLLAWSHRRAAAATLVLLAPWLYALSHLPSRHENYPARLLDASAWAAGLHAAPQILAGCAGRLVQLPWSMVSIAALLATAAAVRQNRAALNCLLAFWLGCAAFLATLLVSPWGPTLYQMTVERMFLHVYPLAAFAVIAVTPRPGKLALAAAAAASLVAYGVRMRGELRPFQGADFYRRTDGWARALRVDGLVPPAARGAVLNDTWYFHLEYMLYPRVVYPAPPEQLAGTWRPWRPWSEVPRADAERLQLQFVLDRNRLALLR